MVYILHQLNALGSRLEFLLVELMELLGGKEARVLFYNMGGSMRDICSLLENECAWWGEHTQFARVHESCTHYLFLTTFVMCCWHTFFVRACDWEENMGPLLEELSHVWTLDIESLWQQWVEHMLTHKGGLVFLVWLLTLKNKLS